MVFLPEVGNADGIGVDVRVENGSDWFDCWRKVRVAKWEGYADFMIIVRGGVPFRVCSVALNDIFNVILFRRVTFCVGDFYIGIDFEQFLNLDEIFF